MAPASREKWTAEELAADPSWIYRLDDAARRDLVAAVEKARDPDKDLLDYRRADFHLGAAEPVIRAAFAEVAHGRGVALLRGLPRDALDEKGFELLTWGIGLNTGVPRPQGKTTFYMSKVQNVGTAYRTATGRGYSSNAELDFHTDTADIVGLACFNRAKEGGLSYITSSPKAHDVMAAEAPELLDLLYEPIHFSRQGEQAPDETPSFPHPIFAEIGGQMFGRWNRNRVNTAQKIEGVPQISARHWEALNRFDDIVRRPDMAYSMYLEPGDMQLVHSHFTLHSRTDFTDHEEMSKRRLLYRLWLSTSDSDRLPDSFRSAYRTTEPGTVRGGIIGQEYDARRRAFDARQAADVGVKYDPALFR